MTQLQDAPKRGRGRPVNPDSLHHKMRHMAVSDEVALFIPAEALQQLDGIDMGERWDPQMTDDERAEVRAARLRVERDVARAKRK